MKGSEIRYDFPGVERLSVILRLTAERIDAELPKGVAVADFRVSVHFPPGTNPILPTYQGGSGHVAFRVVGLPTDRLGR